MEVKRFSALRGNVLAMELDDKLQEIVSGATKASGYPIALISIILRRTQYFRAHVGLADELVKLRSTDSCASFCQYVVKSKKPLRIKDARKEPTLPQQLVDLYGIRAYCGFPVEIDNEVVGSLCIIDTKPNEVTSDMEAILLNLAKQASARLHEMSGDRSGWKNIKEEQVVPTGKLWDEITIAKQEMRMAMSSLYPLIQRESNSVIPLEDAKLSYKDLQAAMTNLEQLLSKLKKHY